MKDLVDRSNHALNALYVTMWNRLRSEGGQTTAEYVGLIVLVVAILAAAATTATDVGTTITSKISEGIDSIQTGGGGGK